MMVPTIHLNGTSREELIRQLMDGGHAISLAIDALGKSSPNGRDYYPQGSDALRAAQLEHAGRVDRLRTVLAEIDELAQQIDDAPGRR